MMTMLFRRARCGLRGIGLLVVPLMAAATLPAAAAPFDVPAIMSPGTSAHLTGKVIWLDLETTHLARAKRFYAELFGWHFRDYHADGTDYTVVLQGGHPIAGMLQRRIRKGEQRPSAWLPFISVRDVDATVSTALQHHAQIESEPQDLPLRGRQALLTDPEGVRFAIEASSSGDPPDTAAAPGAWLWTALITRDAGEAAVFYQQVFGYAVLGLPSDAGFERIRLSTNGLTRISISAMPADAVSLHAYWINFVRVDNAADLVARVLGLGGQVLLNVQRNSHGDQSAVLADPTGAPFGITELPRKDAASPSP